MIPHAYHLHPFNAYHPISADTCEQQARNILEHAHEAIRRRQIAMTISRIRTNIMDLVCVVVPVVHYVMRFRILYGSLSNVVSSHSFTVSGLGG